MDATITEPLSRLAIALAIGLLIGVERGWRSREAPEGARVAGLRTFSLLGLLGGVGGLLVPAAGPLPLAVLLLGAALVLGAFRLRAGADLSDYGATTVVAGVLCVALGALAVLGERQLAAAGGVAAVLMLALKGALHGWLARLTWPELRAALTLLAMSCLVLPLLPDRDLGPWGVFNPYVVWLLTVLIAAASFAGYVAVRIAGDRFGPLLAGMAGGLVSSTAVTVAFARQARDGGAPGHLAAGATLAGVVMLVRVGVLAGALAPALLPVVVPALAAAAGASVLAVLVLLLGRPAARGGAMALRNPFDLWSVLQLGALLAAVAALARVVAALAGPAGVMVVAAVSGLVDVDAVTISVARLVPDAMGTVPAGAAVLLAAAVNTLSKAVTAWVVGGRQIGQRMVAAAAAAIAAGGAALLLAA